MHNPLGLNMLSPYKSLEKTIVLRTIGRLIRNYHLLLRSRRGDSRIAPAIQGTTEYSVISPRRGEIDHTLSVPSFPAAGVLVPFLLKE
jgi:hypothetical protein